MRITSQLIRSRARGPLHSVEYLDLSGLDIVAIERLGPCHKLQTLILRENNIDAVENLSGCHQLWKLDLSNNRVSSLEGLSRFVSMGTLMLSNNDIAWQELIKIRHMHILDLSLHGNSKLEKDPYYRIHVIDCLPNVWILDGRLITTAERIQVEHFFQDSALTDHPVRHKFSKEQFIPSSMKKIEVNGIFGAKTTHLMTRFPSSGAKNIETDHRRLKYLAYNLESDLILESQHRKMDPRLTLTQTFLEDLIDVRRVEREQCNMLLLLLVASLEFAIPTYLMKETLDAAKLGSLGYVPCIELFLLNRQERCLISSLLLSAVKVDRDEKEDGGLYDRLYLCLYYTVSELNKRQQRELQHLKKTSVNPIYKEYKCLLAAEVVQLLCIVPAFFDFIEKDNGIINLLIAATSDNSIIHKIGNIVDKARSNKNDVRRLYEDLAKFILQCIQRNAKNVINKQISPRSQSKFVLSNGLPKRPHSSPIYSPLSTSDYIAKGRSTPDHRRVRPLTARKWKEFDTIKTPMLGDKVLAGPQNVGYIIALPELDIALIQMDAVPAPNGAVGVLPKNIEAHYNYMDMKQLEWNRSGYWRPKGTIGDRITIQKLDVGDMDDDMPNPPSTPTHHGSAQSLAALDEDSNKNDETPRPVSIVLRDKLDLKLTLTEDMLKSSALIKENRNPLHNDVEKLLVQNRIVNNVTHDDNDALSIEHIDNALYDCLKDAMETVRINSARKDDHSKMENVKPHRDFSNYMKSQRTSQSNFIKTPTMMVESLDTCADQGTDVKSKIAAEDDEIRSESSLKERRSRPPSSRPLSTMTEREIDEITLDEVAEVNYTQSTNDRRHSLESNEEHELGVFTDDKNADVLHDGSGSPRSTANPSRAKSAMQRSSSSRSVCTQRSLKVIVSQQTQPLMDFDITRPDSSTITEYQRERTEAWRKTGVVVSVTPSPTPRVSLQGRISPPPQRPSSPLSSTSRSIYKPRPNPKTGTMLYIKSANDWLGGGRNLHYMAAGQRPKSGHVPGYLEGMEPRMRSLQANRFRNRPSKSAGLSRSNSRSGNRLHRSMETLMPDYVQQSRQHPMRQLGNPSYGSPKRPPSPLNMTYR